MLYFNKNICEKKNKTMFFFLSVRFVATPLKLLFQFFALRIVPVSLPATNIDSWGRSCLSEGVLCRSSMVLTP